MSSKTTRMLLVVGLALTTLLSLSPPASATNEYRLESSMHFGRIDIQTNLFGTFNLDVPVPGIECPGANTVKMEFDDRDNSAELTELGFKIMRIEFPMFGSYQLDMTDIPNSRTRGTWNTESGVWGGIREDIFFEMHEWNEETCEKGTPVCRGSLDMEFSGTTRFGAEGPIPGPVSPVWISGVTERRIEVEECGGIWSFILPDADIRLNANPDEPFHGSDPGAEFR